jgi:predicted secreted hydrolase
MTAAPGAEQPYGLELRLVDEKPPALHHGGYITYGNEGSSYYYSRTRLAASGLLRDASGATVTVLGLAWADHQWGDFVISGTGGWDWFSIQLDNNTELMLYVLRDRAGATSAVFGSLIMPDGTVQDIGPGSVRVEATGQWLSPHSAATYPSGWLVELPEQHLLLTVTPQLQDQELYFPGAVFAGPTYWEGAVDVHASGAGSPTGVGYVELTGYAQLEPASQ